MSKTNKITTTTTSRVKALFSFNYYDRDGERLFKGVYLHLDPHNVILRFDSEENLLELRDIIDKFITAIKGGLRKIELCLKTHNILLRFNNVSDVEKLRQDVNEFLIDCGENQEEETGDED